jgi:hypothetical protein
VKQADSYKRIDSNAVHKFNESPELILVSKLSFETIMKQTQFLSLTQGVLCDQVFMIDSCIIGSQERHQNGASREVVFSSSSSTPM